MVNHNDTWKSVLRSAALTCPQPTAVCASQVLRSRTPAETVDACLKTGEVLARYIAYLALSSYTVRDDAESDCEYLASMDIEGPLAFGTYLAIAQRMAKAPFKHPLGPFMSPFAQKKKGSGPADRALTALLQLRNHLGHNLSAMSDAKAQSILGKDEPQLRLAEAFSALEGVLSLPLFIVEDQQLAKGRILARVLWLMGESQDPEPREHYIDKAVHEPKHPYVSCRGQILHLWPYMIWGILPKREAYGLLLLDSVEKEELLHQALDGTRESANGDSGKHLRAVLTGEPGREEHVVLETGESLDQHWSLERRLRREAASRAEGTMPWEDFDQDTLRWYADRLGRKNGEEPIILIKDQLLDGRVRFLEQEIVQCLLLFGTEQSIRQTLTRDMIDLRARTTGSQRWDERIAVTQNVLISLRRAVEFFASHIGMDDASLEVLTETSGSADYLAMREALVNLFIHQDYTDASAAAQVVLKPDEAVFFNTGFSLVDAALLESGGRSQSRNPIIARALRLIGFAELAGSGIRALQRAWRQEVRVPPQFNSDREANSFTVLLSWETADVAYDEEWMNRLGVRLSEDQVRILELACASDGISKSQLPSDTGQSPEDILNALRYLKTQGLIDEQEGTYRAKEHIREMIEK